MPKPKPRRTVRPIPRHGRDDVVRPVSNLFFDGRVRRWRQRDGRFAKPPEIRLTTERRIVSRTIKGKARRVSIVIDFYWDFRASRYRSIATGAFVKPRSDQLLITRRARPHRKGKVNRWKVVIGTGFDYRRRKRKGTWLEWDVVGAFVEPSDVIAFLAQRSRLFRDVLETGAEPNVALVGPEKGKERFVGRRVRRTFRTVSKEIEKG